MDAPPVGFQLGLAGTTGTDAAVHPGTATGLPGHRFTPTAQARQEVLELSEFDLRLALLGAGVLGEDVQDQGGPVDHLDLELVLQLPKLAGRELTVADDGVRPGGGDDVAQLADLARADVSAWVGAVAALDDGLQHLRAGGLGEPGELGQ